jgi:RNA polymerase sigma-70 factor (ECF subfamily)
MHSVLFEMWVIVSLKRDPNTLEELVKEHSKYLLFMARKLGVSHDKQSDVIQNTWMTFIEKIENFQGRSKVRTYLTGVMFNKVREMRRSDGKHAHETFAPGEETYETMWENRFDHTGHWVTPPIGPEDFSMKAETASIIEKCLENLPEVQKAMFSLKEIEGVSNKEISGMLEQSISNVGVLLFRAKNKLRDCISLASGQ